MNWWTRVGRLLPGTREEAASAVEPLPAAAAPSPAVPARDLDALFRVVEVADADFLVGDLFRRRFGTDSFPSTPKHFVAFYRDDAGGLLPLGYVHFEIWEAQAMGGGLVIDERLYRRVPASDRDVIRARGGVAELLLGASIALLPRDLIGIWGYVGNKQAEKVDLRVGFRHTGVPHVMVIWRNEPDDAGKAHWLQRVVEYGPF
ncbi:hypothetical protein ACNQFN_21045 [Thauera butanivorans]|uniref:hypothetical protein n=1 Tax=Thauera butanivorans TaxID=86174 RepID=UPI003AB642FC